MLKVNEEKILADYASLVEKKEKGLSAVEADAKAYAVAHGYDEVKTAKFVAFTQEIQGSGLSDKELEKLEVLGSYIEEVEELVGEIAQEEVAETSVDSLNAKSATVNNV